MSERMVVVINLTSSDDDEPNNNNDSSNENSNGNSNTYDHCMPQHYFCHDTPAFVHNNRRNALPPAIQAAVAAAVAAAAAETEEPKEPPRKKQKRPPYISWQEMYERLVSYKAKFGNTCVPIDYKDDPRFGRWVKRQRSRCEDPSRIDLLNIIGFEWQFGKTLMYPSWETMYERLVKYKKNHKTTKVPFRYTEDTTLGIWVANQRRQCKKKDRVDLLDAIGFAWAAKDQESSVCQNDELFELEIIV